MARIRTTFEDYLAAVKEDERGCWILPYTTANGGYVSVQDGEPGARIARKAHRVFYERLVGPIPIGLTIDHLCRNRACVNPKHLEPVPHVVNVVRGEGIGVINLRKTNCPHGHPLDGRSSRRRYCLECKRIAGRVARRNVRPTPERRAARNARDRARRAAKRAILEGIVV